TVSSEDDEETKFIKALFECPDITELITTEEIKTGVSTNHLIDDFDYYEDFEDICAYQAMETTKYLFTKYWESYCHLKKKNPNISETAETEPVPKLTYDLLIEKYELIEPDGEKYEFIDEELISSGRLLTRTATDYNLGEVFLRRGDGTNILWNSDGVQTVTFPNGIRIITFVIVEEEEIYPEWTKEELEFIKLFENNVHSSLSSKSHSEADISQQTVKEILEEEPHLSDGYISVHIEYTIEHNNYATVSIDRCSNNIKIVSPNNTIVTIDINNIFHMKLDDDTVANFDGNMLHVDYEACPTCKTHTTCDIQIDHIDSNINNTEKMDIPWLQMQDSFCKRLIANNEGALSLLENNVSQESAKEHSTCVDSSSSKSTVQAEYELTEEIKQEPRHRDCRERILAKSLRFFVLKRNMSCSELVNRKIVEEYWKACERFSWCSTNSYDTFGDQRRLVSILYPLFVTETEKWLMDSKLTDKPQNLTFKDLKKDCKKGFYPWMRPYGRFEPEPKKPKILEQQWRGEDRASLKGARELVQAIIKYSEVMASDCHAILQNPIIDHRAHVERKTHKALQALGKRIYDELKHKIADDISSRAKISLTTDPAKIVCEETISGEGSYISETVPGESGDLEELDSIVKMSPNLQRYWERRAELLKEEEFYLYLLRESGVPPYFLNMLGGAIWWEVNHLVDVAAGDGQKKTTQCICAADMDLKHDEVGHKEGHGEIGALRRHATAVGALLARSSANVCAVASLVCPKQERDRSADASSLAARAVRPRPLLRSVPVSLRAWAALAPAWRLPLRVGKSSRLPQAEDDTRAREL
ncbi:unnamed protein product, partial [Plutella xylostella]